ncbi:MAG TPA: hypothetical protein GX739_05715 [Firmicutes bacterium]|nr:hypothetical protein [Bacillota bacterium]
MGRIPTIDHCLQAQVRGPRLERLNLVFPPGTRVISNQIEGSLIWVNFNRALVENEMNQ